MDSLSSRRWGFSGPPAPSARECRGLGRHRPRLRSASGRGKSSSLSMIRPC